jgi:hypothetical protein
MFTYSGNIKTTLLKIISICTYIFLFAYNIYQTTVYSYMLYDVKNTLYKRICNLNIFIKEAAKIIETTKNKLLIDSRLCLLSRLSFEKNTSTLDLFIFINKVINK